MFGLDRLGRALPDRFADDLESLRAAGAARHGRGAVGAGGTADAARLRRHRGPAQCRTPERDVQEASASCSARSSDRPCSSASGPVYGIFANVVDLSAPDAVPLPHQVHRPSARRRRAAGAIDAAGGGAHHQERRGQSGDRFHDHSRWSRIVLHRSVAAVGDAGLRCRRSALGTWARRTVCCCSPPVRAVSSVACCSRRPGGSNRTSRLPSSAHRSTGWPSWGSRSPTTICWP